MVLDTDASERAVSTVAKALGLPLKQAAAAIIDLVNESMLGALRVVSVQQGHDPREFALMGFGGAGPLHANALGRLLNSWPVIIPPSPGVLCAYGDATTNLRSEASRSFIRLLSDTSDAEVEAIFAALEATVRAELKDAGVAADQLTATYEADVRYHGQGFQLAVEASMRDGRLAQGFEAVARAFDQTHDRLFSFALPERHELVNLRVIVSAPAPAIAAERMPVEGPDPSAAMTDETTVFVDGSDRRATVYDRGRLRAGNLIDGPAVITEMDSTTLVLPDHRGRVDALGNILIAPSHTDAGT
jgi:N-methylhydantoinase A